VTGPAAPLPDLAAQLHALAERVDGLAAADIAGELERLRFTLWQTMTAPPAPASPDSSRALDVGAVIARTGMSKQWLYRAARAKQLPFARRIGRRLVFDEAGLERWLAGRRPR
jgi:predicted DNA-binding transcriptional regulator AlpA